MQLQNAWNLSSTPYDTQDFQQQLGNTGKCNQRITSEPFQLGNAINLKFQLRTHHRQLK